jgi:hypothetical protein
MKPQPPSNRPINLQKVHIGVIGVDTGRVILGDPGYLLPGGELSIVLGNEHLQGAKQLEQLEFKPGVPGLAVVVESGYGDGLYPVTALVDQDGVIHQVIVEFVETPTESEGEAPCAAFVE